MKYPQYVGKNDKFMKESCELTGIETPLVINDSRAMLIKNKSSAVNSQTASTGTHSQNFY